MLRARQCSRGGGLQGSGHFREKPGRTLQDVESMALNRLAEYEVAIAELEAITGNPTPNQSGKDIPK